MISPIWLIVLPLLMAFVSVLIKKQQALLTIICMIATISILWFSESGITILGGFRPPFGISLKLDQYAFVALLLVQFIMLITLVLGKEHTSKYGSVLLVMMAGVNGMLLTNDLFNLFVMIEVVSIAAFILSATNGKLTQTFHYLVMGSLGGVFFLLGTVLVYTYTGTLVIEQLNLKLAVLPTAVSVVPMLLILLGLSVELKLMPVGSWAKGIYGNSNTLTGAVFASVLAPAFGFVVGRLLMHVVVLNQWTGLALLLMALGTFAFGEVTAYGQTDLRRTLAFSSIGQSGLVVMLFTLGLEFPALLLLVSNALSKAVLYWVSTGLGSVYGSTQREGLKGVFYHHHLMGVAFSIASLSMVGIPLFFGFYVEVSLIMSIFGKGIFWLPAVILLIAIVKGAYSIKWILSLWSPATEGHLATNEEIPEKKKIYSAVGLISIVLVSLIILVFGLFPFTIGQVLNDATRGSIPMIEKMVERGGQLWL